MFLTYGRQVEGERLVHIAEAERGNACRLFCPFCGGALTARKGDFIGHHFAHQTDSCRSTSADAEDFIPSYESYFILGLTGPQRQALQRLIEQYGYKPFYAGAVNARVLTSLHQKRFVSTWLQPRYITEPGLIKAGRLTDKAKAFAGQLSLSDFAALMLAEFDRSQAQLQSRTDDESQVACHILDRELERLRQTFLYFLEIDTDRGVIHKIGITTREIEERILEIKAFLKQHLTVHAITPLFCFAGIPFVENYFKVRYGTYRLNVKPATEYFNFEAIESVKAELAQLHQAVVGVKAVPKVSDPNRSRFRVVFERYDRQPNKFAPSGWQRVLLLVDLTNLATGERFTDWQWFARGKQIDALGQLERGDIIEFTASIEGNQLKRPAQIIRVEEYL